MAERLQKLSAHIVAPNAASGGSFSAFADSSAALHGLFEGRPNLMLVPIATPLLPPTAASSSESPRLDVASLKRYITRIYDAGYEGIYVGGSSGEGYHMEEALRMELCSACVEATRGTGKIAMVHVGAAHVSESLRLAAHAAAAGADSIASIPPYVGSPVPTFDEVLAFYTELARVSSPAPVICYNIPGLTGSKLSVDELASLLAIPGVEGIKYSDPDVASIGELVSNTSSAPLSRGGTCAAVYCGA